MYQIVTNDKLQAQHLTKPWPQQANTAQYARVYEY